MNGSAFITGCNGGIGQALVEQFNAEGWKVFGTDVAEDPLTGLNLSAYETLDLSEFVTDEAYRQDIMARMRAKLADLGPLKALINNAAFQVVAPIDELTLQNWRASLDINLIAPFMLTQAWLPELESGKGCVLNIGSIHAKATKPNFVAYATSKAALVGLTRALAVEIGKRVRVNALCPAAVATPMLLDGFKDNENELQLLGTMHPVGRIAEPSEVANAAVFMCDQKQQFLNGAVLYLDGGIGVRLHDPM